ncbi:uncharacterized protein LOC134831190 [Culicoides brevitarsis]|uniref:uncharacterized protein LOC134831190 n=1 Tax=Culicoides brevitarsis TaxID=469753 RepID=UPI00307B7F28
MDPKRITLDLTQIFQDYRKKAFVLIRPQWKNIESLHSHIINLFGLEHYIYLTNSDGIVYPAAENPDVIDQNDTVVVHKITKDQLLAPNPQKLTTKSDDCQLVEPQSSSSGSESDDEASALDRIKKKVVELKKQQQQKVSQAPPSALNDAVVKRKRKRVRKRKPKQSEKRSCPSTSASKLKNEPSKTWLSDARNVHLRFSDNASSSETSSETESDSNDEKPSRPCKFKAETEVPARKIRPVVRCWDSQSQNYRPIEDEIDSSNVPVERSTLPNLRIDPPSNDVPIIGPILPENTTDCLSEAEVPTVPPVSTPKTALPSKMESLEELRKEIAHLNLPVVDQKSPNLKVSDTIAFKLLRMDDQCQPTISDYIIGCIEKANTDFSEMTIRLLAGKSEVGSRICSTVITEENEIGVVEDDHIEVSFKELYEPRFCLFTM